jgi:hypothetical protein
VEETSISQRTKKQQLGCDEWRKLVSSKWPMTSSMGLRSKTSARPYTRWLEYKVPSLLYYFILITLHTAAQNAMKTEGCLEKMRNSKKHATARHGWKELVPLQNDERPIPWAWEGRPLQKFACVADME